MLLVEFFVIKFVPGFPLLHVVQTVNHHRRFYPIALLVVENSKKTRGRMIKCNCGVRSSAGVT